MLKNSRRNNTAITCKDYSLVAALLLVLCKALKASRETAKLVTLSVRI